MPGYPPLSSSIGGAAAESARVAESLHRRGASEQAVRLLEEALEASLATSPVLPGWLCGRLASLYRAVGRLDDEVHLLERYRDSQVEDDARTRYEARLSKARTLADRRRRPESGALSSIRRCIVTPRRPPRAIRHAPPAEPLPEAALQRLTEVFARSPEERILPGLDEALGDYVASARSRQLPMELLVDGLRQASSAADIRAQHAPAGYSAALVRLLALWFCDDPRGG